MRAGAAPRLVLASGSPRRRELLRQAGFRFETRIPRVDEALTPGETLGESCVKLAVKKALAVAARLRGGGPAVVLAADTLVGDGERILGKARGPAEARAILARLSGSVHRVVTGVCLCQVPVGRRRSFRVETRVTMRRWSPAEINAYVKSGEWKGKAGAYAIQETADRFVTSVRGSRTNVVGLPMERVVAELARLGVKGAASRPSRSKDRGSAAEAGSRPASRPRSAKPPRTAGHSRPRPRARRRA
jgi:septum formation protein